MTATIFTGVDAPDLIACLLRCWLGAFMVLARFRWFYDPSRPEEPFLNTARHANLARVVAGTGLKHPVWPVLTAVGEVLAGLALIAGLMTIPAAVAMLVILAVASYCKTGEKVAKQNPVDGIDVCAAYLWTPEPGYKLAAIGVLLLGPGKYSLDAMLGFQPFAIIVAAALGLAALVLGFLVWMRSHPATSRAIQ